MEEFDQGLPEPHYARPGARLVIDIRNKETKAAVDSEALRRGLAVAMALFELEGVSPYVAYCSDFLLARDLHDVRENPEPSAEGDQKYQDLVPWASVWGQAEFIALEDALRDYPEDIYEYRFLVDWDNRRAGEEDEHWGMHRKQAGEVYKPYWYINSLGV